MKKIVLSFILISLSVSIASAQVEKKYSDENLNYSASIMTVTKNIIIKDKPVKPAPVMVPQTEKKITAPQKVKKTKGRIGGYLDFGAGLTDFTGSANINFLLGYRFSKKLFAGVGIGYEASLEYPVLHYRGALSESSYDSNTRYIPASNLNTSVENMGDYYSRPYIPLYANIRYNFLDKVFSPFVGLSIGSTLSKREATGFLLEGILGIDFFIKHKIPIGISFKPRYQSNYVNYGNFIHYAAESPDHADGSCRFHDTEHYHFGLYSRGVFVMNFNLSIGF